MHANLMMKIRIKNKRKINSPRQSNEDGLLEKENININDPSNECDIKCISYKSKESNGIIETNITSRSKLEIKHLTNSGANDSMPNTGNEENVESQEVGMTAGANDLSLSYKETPKNRISIYDSEDVMLLSPTPKIQLTSANRMIKGSGRKKTSDLSSILSNMKKFNLLSEVEKYEAAAAASSNIDASGDGTMVDSNAVSSMSCSPIDVSKKVTSKTDSNAVSRRSSLSKPITLKRIQRHHDNRTKLEEIDNTITAHKREEEINKKLNERKNELQLQLQLIKVESLEVLKRYIPGLTNVMKQTKHNSAKTEDGHWISKNEMVTGWKSYSEIIQERNLKLMMHIVKKYNHKSETRKMLVKKILDLVGSCQEY